MLRKTSILIPSVLLLFWGTMMGLLVYREVVIPRMRYSPVVRHAEAPQDLWLGVFTVRGERLGFINSRSTPGLRESGRGMDVRLMARVETSMFSMKAEFSILGKAWIDPQKGLLDFDFKLRSGEQEIQVNGAIKDGTLEAKLLTAGETIPFQFPVGNALMLSGGMGMPSLDVPLLEPGREAYVDTFDPTTMSMGKALIVCQGKETLEVSGKPVDTWVMATTIGGITTKAWVTEQEEVVRAETPFGFVLKKLSPEEAMKPVAPSEAASLVRNLAVKPTGKTPRRGAKQLWVQFGGVTEEHMPPVDENQTRTAQGYLISQPAPPLGPISAEMLRDAPADSLESDMFVQSGHEKIKAAALSAVGDATDVWKRAERLNAWVFDTIEKIPVIGVPSALDVLNTRQGDCNEHTVLFVAMARSLGIPSRIAIGLVWSDDLGGFGYHAWPEVYTGRWIPMDPTFGQVVADATHIKLLNGGVEKWSQLLPFIGQITIDVLGVE